MSDARWWRNVPDFVAEQGRGSFRAWVAALDQGIELCVDTPQDWFPGLPEGDWFSDEAISYVEHNMIERFAIRGAPQPDFAALVPFIKYLGQMYVDKLEAQWVVVPKVDGLWDAPGWAVELPWRYDWFLDIEAAVIAALARHSGDQWLLALSRHRADYQHWKDSGAVIDRFSTQQAAGCDAPAPRRTLLSRFSRTPSIPVDRPAVDCAKDRYQFVRALALEGLARRGIDVQPAQHDSLGEDRFVDQDGHEYDLHNLQLRCALLAQSEWVGAVEFQLHQLLAGRDGPAAEELSEGEFLRQVRTRLVPPNTSEKLSMAYARPAFDGLVVELSRDLPTVVKTVGDSDVAGRNLDALYAAGQTNTDAELASVQQLEHDVYALTGESFFIASKALNMEHLIDTVLGGSAPLGVVFSVPHRSLLLLHRVGASSPSAVGWIASVTLSQTENAAGGVVSRDTYFWYRDAVQCITNIDLEAPSIEVLVGGAFAEALNQVR